MPQSKDHTQTSFKNVAERLTLWVDNSAGRYTLSCGVSEIIFTAK